MTETVVTTAPLTRREAREIERRTGRRHVAGAVAPVSMPLLPAAELTVPEVSFEHDTAEIERNPETGLVSVFPTAMLERVADVIPAADVTVADEAAAFVRPISIRAPRPASLVARSRRRTVVGVGIAASAAVLATAAVAVPGVSAQQQQQAQQAAQASLVTADTIDAGDAQVDDAAVQGAPAADLVAAPAVAADRAQYAVTSLSADEVASAVETVTPVVDNTPVETSSPVSTGGSDDSSTGSTGNTGNSGGGSSYGGSSYGGDLSGVAGIAESMMGGGNGWLCTDFTRAVYAQMGISLPAGTVSAQAAGGVQTSNPQVGDLVVFSSGHIGIYAGGGMMWDNPGYYSSHVGWQNVYRSISVIGSSYYFVTYR